MITVELLGAPLGKERLRVRRATGIQYTPERTINYESRLALVAQEAMAGRPLLLGPIAIDLRIYMPIPVSKSKRFVADALAGKQRPLSKPDWDNVAKILDGVNQVVWRDDAEVVEAHVYKFYSDRPRLTLKAWPLEQDVFS